MRSGGSLVADLTAEALVYFVEFVDLESKDGKSEVWQTLQRLSGGKYANRTEAYEKGRDYYRSTGISMQNAYATMLLDIAAELPDSEEYLDKIESLRPADHGDNDIDDSVEMEAEERVEAVVEKRAAVADIDKVVREITKAKTLNMAKTVVWVTSHLQTKPELIDLDEVPSMWAWTTYNWARDGNETEYRRLYDSKLIPTGGLGIAKDLGFVDDGKAVHAIYLAMIDPETGIAALSGKKGDSK
jgi:hypothetical protein